MSVPGSYEYGPDWEPEDMFGAERPIHPYKESSEVEDDTDDSGDMPPDPVFDERDLLEEPRPDRH
jgi:hypothetical protein